MSKFYINVNGCTSCFIKTIKRICRQMGYKFNPNNKKQYLVDTEKKECIGVSNIISGICFVDDKTSYRDLKKKFL